MYAQGGAILRADLRGVVEEAFSTSELFIGPKVMPPLPVPAKAGQYPLITKESAGLLRSGNVVRRGSGAAYSRDASSYSNDTYTCIEYGCEAIVPDDASADASRFFSLESFETRRKYRHIQLAHESRVAAKIFAPATFNQSTSATAYTAANLTTFDIGLDLDLCKEQIQTRGESVTDLTVVMSLPVFLRARASTRLQNRIRGTVSTDTQLILDAQAMADALEVKEVLVGRAAYDTTQDNNATSSLTNCWNNTYIWIGTVRPAAGPNDFFSGSVGYTLFWQQDADIIQVESYREENIRSTIVRARQFTDEKIVLADGAQLFQTQYS
jgi:hypothetical protein